MSELDREEILAYFNAFDSKKNGVLEFSEFVALIKSFGLNFAEDQL